MDDKNALYVRSFFDSAVLQCVDHQFDIQEPGKFPTNVK